jgi:hypothetical protein
MTTREDLTHYNWIFIYKHKNSSRELWLNPNNIPMRVSFENDIILNIQINTYHET